MKLFQIKKCKLKILFEKVYWKRFMLGKIVEKWGRARFYLSRNYSGSLYSLKKKLFFKLKNLHSSACFNLNYDAAKQ